MKEKKKVPEYRQSSNNARFQAQASIRTGYRFWCKMKTQALGSILKNFKMAKKSIEPKVESF